MKTKRWIMRVPVLSMRHITPESGNSEIDDMEIFGELSAIAMPHGFMLFNGLELEYLNQGNIPKDVWIVLEWMQKNQHEWIRFDADGDIYDELPTYEW